MSISTKVPKYDTQKKYAKENIITSYGFSSMSLQFTMSTFLMQRPKSADLALGFLDQEQTLTCSIQWLSLSMAKQNTLTKSFRLLWIITKKSIDTTVTNLPRRTFFVTIWDWYIPSIGICECFNIKGQNLKLLLKWNRQNLTYKLAPNHLTDTSNEERMDVTGRMGRSRPMHGIDLKNTAKLFKYNQEDVDALPSELNWVKEGAVFPPKDQASCGSCWSFATTGTLEGSYFLKTGDLVRLSEQALMDCSWGMGNNGCDGGEECRWLHNF